MLLVSLRLGIAMAAWGRILFFFVIAETVGASEKRNFRFVFDTVNINHWVPDIVDALNHTITQLNNRSYVSGYLILKRNIDNLYVNTTMDFWKGGTEKRRLYNLYMDACQFLSMVHKNLLLNIFSKSFKKHTNGILTCPLKAVNISLIYYCDMPISLSLNSQKFNYTLNNWFLDEEDFPNFLPEGTFQTLTEYLIHKKKAFRILTRGRIVY
ncbi:hypothetical protein KR222_004930 [Zaprionus bogoriensis]|nr:hypothetical protein KR222_004930 [Zaprionus bogoriensis]